MLGSSPQAQVCVRRCIPGAVASTVPFFQLLHVAVTDQVLERLDGERFAAWIGQGLINLLGRFLIGYADAFFGIAQMLRQLGARSARLASRAAVTPGETLLLAKGNDAFLALDDDIKIPGPRLGSFLRAEGCLGLGADLCGHAAASTADSTGQA